MVLGTKIAVITFDSVTLLTFLVCSIIVILRRLRKKNMKQIHTDTNEVFEPLPFKNNKAITFQWIVLIAFHILCSIFGTITICIGLYYDYVDDKEFNVYFGLLSNISFIVFTVYHVVQIILCPLYFINKS
jgi:hypothetical protein